MVTVLPPPMTQIQEAFPSLPVEPPLLAQTRMVVHECHVPEWCQGGRGRSCAWSGKDRRTDLPVGGVQHESGQVGESGHPEPRGPRPGSVVPRRTTSGPARWEDDEVRRAARVASS